MRYLNGANENYSVLFIFTKVFFGNYCSYNARPVFVAKKSTTNYYQPMFTVSKSQQSFPLRGVFNIISEKLHQHHHSPGQQLTISSVYNRNCWSSLQEWQGNVTCHADCQTGGVRDQSRHRISHKMFYVGSW